MIYIEDLLGVRYKDFGRDVKEGLDCLGLAIEVEKRFGNTLLDTPEALVRRKDRDCIEVREKIENLEGKNVIVVDKPEKEGDLILFNNSGVLNHCGVYLGDGLFIHCNIHGVHIEKINMFTSPIGKVYRWL